MGIRKMTESEAIATRNALRRNAPVETILDASSKDSPCYSRRIRKANLFDQKFMDERLTWDHVLTACFGLDWGPPIFGVVLCSGKHIPITPPMFE